MTNEQFITGIRKAVYEPTVDGIVSLLKKPPGRRASPNLVALSAWFNQLAPEDRERVRAAIQLAARQAVFGMLAVLDGVRSITETAGEAGSLELRSTNQSGTILLNDPAAVALHDLFAEQVSPP